MRAANRRDDGQSLVEFALVLPILALLLMGIIDFGMIFSRWLMIEHAASDAARWVTLSGQTQSVTTQAQNMAQQEAGGDAVATVSFSTYTATPAPIANQTAALTFTRVTVVVNSTVQLFDPLLAAIVGPQYTVTSTVTMLVE